MNLFQFATDSPWLAFFMLLLLVEGVCKIVSRILRTLMVRKQGWPPGHLDADGDWKPEGLK